MGGRTTYLLSNNVGWLDEDIHHSDKSGGDEDDGGDDDGGDGRGGDDHNIRAKVMLMEGFMVLVKANEMVLCHEIQIIVPHKIQIMEIDQNFATT